jgi:pectinesterase inhibitor-like protein
MVRAAAGVVVSFWLLFVIVVEADDVVIGRVCSATRYPSSCLSAFQRDGRWQNASALGLVEGMTAMATERSLAAVADAHTLGVRIAPAANNMNLTTLAAGCTELLDLAEFYVQRSHAAFATAPLEDIQAWLSGALTQSNDCYYSLTKFQSTASSTLAFVAAMTDRMNSTVELISIALALTDARLAFGPDATLWRPPPESRAQQLQRLATPSPPSITDANLAIELTNSVPDVTVALNSTHPSIQAAVDNAPSWSPKRQGSKKTSSSPSSI